MRSKDTMIHHTTLEYAFRYDDDEWIDIRSLSFRDQRPVYIILPRSWNDSSKQYVDPIAEFSLGNNWEVQFDREVKDDIIIEGCYSFADYKELE